jgi:hypothetical protein
MFKFDLKQIVRTDAGALGTVVGRAEYDGRPHSYLVRFAAEPQRETSFSEGQLTPEPVAEQQVDDHPHAKGKATAAAASAHAESKGKKA